MTEVLLFGPTGQLGQSLRMARWPSGWNLTSLGRAEADFADADGLAAAVRQYRPDLIVNAAAYTAVDRAEAEQGIAWQVNAVAPGVLAQAASKIGAALVHVSTDYVFDGRKQGEWEEDDVVGPLNAYGTSKAAGEIAICAALERHLILRVSWLYGRRGRNFVRTVLKAGRGREQLSIVDDQWGRPTCADDLASGLIAAAERALAEDSHWGTYHFANSGKPVTWAGFARQIFADAVGKDGRAPEVIPICTSDDPRAAKRPANSVLALDKWRQTFGHTPRPWQVALGATLSSFGSSASPG